MPFDGSEGRWPEIEEDKTAERQGSRRRLNVKLGKNRPAARLDQASSLA
jgi:hypothetical protein